VNVDNPDLCALGFRAEGAFQLGAGKYFAARLDEGNKNTIFAAGQLDGFTVDADLTGGGDNGDRACSEDFTDIFFGGVGTPQDGFNSGDENGGAEGLGDVVIGADTKAYDDIGFLVLGGEQDDWDVGGCRGVFEFAGELDAGSIGQHDVEQDEVGLVGADTCHGLCGVFGGSDDVAFRAEVHSEQLEQVSLIVHD